VVWCEEIVLWRWNPLGITGRKANLRQTSTYIHRFRLLSPLSMRYRFTFVPYSELPNWFHPNVCYHAVSEYPHLQHPIRCRLCASLRVTQNMCCPTQGSPGPMVQSDSASSRSDFVQRCKYIQFTSCVTSLNTALGFVGTRHPYECAVLHLPESPASDRIPKVRSAALQSPAQLQHLR